MTEPLVRRGDLWRDISRRCHRRRFRGLPPKQPDCFEKAIGRGPHRAQRRRVVRGLAVGVFGCAVAASALAESVWQIHPKGLGPILVGMPVSAVTRSAGVPVLPIGSVEASDKFGSSCNYHSVDVPGQTVRIRVKDGLVDRLEVESAGFATPGGIRVGDPIANVRKIYGSKANEEPHHYLWDRGFVHTVVGPYTIENEAFAIAFIGSQRTGVTAIWSSRYRNIRESEGCQ